MNNFSTKSTEELKELSEDFSEIAVKLSECYDKLAEVFSEHRVDTMDIPNHLCSLSEILSYVENATLELGYAAEKHHTLSDDERFLMSFG